MTDDIVMRLRFPILQIGEEDAVWILRTVREREEAAAEIERLRVVLMQAVDDTPGWYDLARSALAGEHSND